MTTRRLQLWMTRGELVRMASVYPLNALRRLIGLNSLTGVLMHKLSAQRQELRASEHNLALISSAFQLDHFYIPERALAASTVVHAGAEC